MVSVFCLVFKQSLSWGVKTLNLTWPGITCSRIRTAWSKWLILVSFFSGQNTPSIDTSHYLQLLPEVCRTVLFGPPCIVSVSKPKYIVLFSLASRCSSIPSVPSYGNMTCSSARDVGSQCTFACSSGYRLTGGTDTRTCTLSEDNASWNGTTPSCTGIPFNCNCWINLHPIHTTILQVWTLFASKCRT